MSAPALAPLFTCARLPRMLVEALEGPIASSASTPFARRHRQLLVDPISRATDNPETTAESRWSEAILRTVERSHPQLVACDGTFGAPRQLSVHER
jgi:hypothetical protein